MNKIVLTLIHNLINVAKSGGSESDTQNFV